VTPGDGPVPVHAPDAPPLVAAIKVLEIPTDL